MAGWDKRDIDLLRGLENIKKAEKSARRYAAFLPAAAAVILAAGVTAACYAARENSVAEMEEAKAKAFSVSQNKELNDVEQIELEAQQAENAVAVSEEIAGKRESSKETFLKFDPEMTKKINGCLAGGNIRCEYASASAGGVSITFSAADPAEIPDFINKTEQTGLFEKVEYSGFTENSGRYLFELNCTVSESDSQDLGET